MFTLRSSCFLLSHDAIRPASGDGVKIVGAVRHTQPFGNPTGSSCPFSAVAASDRRPRHGRRTWPLRRCGPAMPIRVAWGPRLSDEKAAEQGLFRQARQNRTQSEEKVK